MLGSPIAHSLSPVLHRAAYAGLGLDWTYDAIEVTEDTLPAFINGLDDTWAGLSLTMPLKESVIPLLDTVDDVALSITSVNTVLPAASGWRGANTDVYGMTQALRQAGLAGQPSSAVVLGAGATARSAIAALASLGVGQVTICARRPEAAEATAVLASGMGLAAGIAGLDPNADRVRCDVLVATLPGDAAAAWAPVASVASGALLDASYHPWPSQLAAAWGGPVIASGRDMLLWQAVEQVRLMTGMVPDAARMRTALPA